MDAKYNEKIHLVARSPISGQDQLKFLLNENDTNWRNDVSYQDKKSQKR